MLEQNCKIFRFNFSTQNSLQNKTRTKALALDGYERAIMEETARRMINEFPNTGPLLDGAKLMLEGGGTKGVNDEMETEQIINVSPIDTGCAMTLCPLFGVLLFI